MSIHIGVWGDSVAEGFKDDEMGGWISRLQACLMGKKDYSIVNNRGVGGETSGHVLKRFDVEAEAILGPGIIVFAIGKNDSARVCDVDEEQFKNNLNKLIEKAQEFSKKIVFVGVGNVDESKTSPFPKGLRPYYVNERIEKYNSIIEKTCHENKLRFVSTHGILDTDKDLFDEVHPNAVGHEKIFRKVLPVVEEMIGEAGNES